MTWAGLGLPDEDVRFVMPGVWTKNGIDEVRALVEWDSMLMSRLEPLGMEALGDRVKGRMVEQNDRFRGMGIEEIRYQRVTFAALGNRIREIEAQLEAESISSTQAALGRMMDWASKVQPETLAKLLPGGEFIYGAEQARAWLRLIGEWRTYGR
jgi:hypothetical protein